MRAANEALGFAGAPSGAHAPGAETRRRCHEQKFRHQHGIESNTRRKSLDIFLKRSTRRQPSR